MDENNKPEDIDKYARDIATIKSLLLGASEMPVIEIWAFFTWGGLLLLGTLLQFILGSYFDFTLKEIFFKVWLPVLLVAAFLETVAWLKRMNREGMPMFSQPMLKFWYGALCMIMALSFIIYITAASGNYPAIPAIALISFALVFILFAQMLAMQMFLYPIFLIISAVIVYFSGLSIFNQSIAAGIILGLTFIAAGITMQIREKRNNG